ncbi:MAG: helix-hairpin-helix domain-containing protein [Cyclobacteriaceae bacterium]
MRALLVSLIFVAFLKSIAQDRQIDLEQFAERLFQVQDSDINYEDIYESLLLYQTSPINLNNTSREELSSLYILTPFQINNFFEHIEENGKLLSINELQVIEGFDLNSIFDLLPFVIVNERTDNRSLVQRIREETNNYFLLRYSRTLEKQAGYKEDGNFTGDPSTIYGRYRVSKSRDFSLGFTFEKDAGEAISWDANKKKYGMDYYSGHFFMENKGVFQTIAVGDFQLQFGQGLVFGAGFGAGKGSETVNSTKRNSIGIRPYASVLESGFFRGVGTTIKKHNLSFSTFYSCLNQDANLINDTTYSDFDEFVNAIQATGFHRTQTELNSKNQILEQNIGGVLEYKFNSRFKIGMASLHTFFDNPIQRKPNNYNQFEFKGDQNSLVSGFFNYGFQNFMLFGEIARSSSGGIGAVGGWMASLTPKIDMSMVLRNYAKDFHSFYGNAFGENSRVINEKGVYWGLKIKPSRKYEFALYYDRFSFPWLRFQAEAPSSGYEYLGRFTYRMSRNVTMFAQMRSESRETNFTDEESNLNTLQEGIKNNYIFNIDYKLNPVLTLKTRVQSSTFQQNGDLSSGYALIQDLNVSFRKVKLSTRAALFDTDDFINRQYVYEKDVLYAFSFPAYNGRGLRNYFLIQYQVFRNLTTWLRISRFNFVDRNTVGSGQNEIDGSRRTDVRFMIRLKI